MDIKPFLKSLFDSTLVDLYSTTPEELQKEIAEGFLTYFGLFKNGSFYILDKDHLSLLSPNELAEELPFTESQIEEYLKYTQSIKLSTRFSSNGIYVQPDNQWAIGGTFSVLKDLIVGKITFFTFPVDIEFTPDIGLHYSLHVTLSNINNEGLFLKVNPEYRSSQNMQCNKKYTGYYASEDGTMDAAVVINKFNLNFNRGNIIKYVIRAGKKNPIKEIEDLEKAKKYIDFEIARIKGE